MRCPIALITTKTDDEVATGRFGVGLKTLARMADSFAVHSWPYAFEVLVDGEGDRRRLRERLTEVDGEWAWQDIALQTVEPAVRTWFRLTQIAAERERLLE